MRRSSVLCVLLLANGCHRVAKRPDAALVQRENDQVAAVAMAGSRYVKERYTGTVALRTLSGVFLPRGRRVGDMRRLDDVTSQIAVASGFVYLPPSVKTPWTCQRGVCTDLTATAIDALLTFDAVYVGTDTSFVYLSATSRGSSVPPIRPTCLLLVRAQERWEVRDTQRGAAAASSDFPRRCQS